MALPGGARLQEHFDAPHATHPDRWHQLWVAGDFLPWDRGTSNPAIIDLLDQKKDVIGDSFVQDEDASTGDKRRKRALVPGCGRGYDVMVLASYGYDAYGLEVSEKAVNLCIDYEKESGDKYPAKDEKVGKGKCTFVKGDVFNNEWNKDLVPNGTFDLIYDYTVSCCHLTATVRSTSVVQPPNTRTPYG